MNNIPDHPDIAAALVTGYPRGHREPKEVRCADCGFGLEGRTEVYFFEGDTLCKGCFWRLIRDRYDSRDLAQMLGAVVKTAYEYGDE